LGDGKIDEIEGDLRETDLKVGQCKRGRGMGGAGRVWADWSRLYVGTMDGESGGLKNLGRREAGAGGEVCLRRGVGAICTKMGR
jgi:hypothetical protein